MSRWARSAVAVAVGFGATSATFAAIEARESAPTQPELIGGVNTFEYCRNEFGIASSAVVVGTTAWAWRCVFTGNNVFQDAPIDFDVACQTQYGQPTAYAESWDLDSPYAWECFFDG